MSDCRTWTPKQWEACKELTTRGSFKQIFTKPQREFYDFFRSNPELGEYCLYTTRKLGKTMTLLGISYELCMAAQKPKLGRFVLPELKMAKDVAYPIIDEMKQFMHKRFWPKLWKSTASLEFHNGSKIILGGAHPDNVDGNRGPFCDFLICDEIAFWDMAKYHYTMFSVLFPQLTLTNGPIFYSTTPPEEVIHPFIVETLAGLRARNAVKTFTIDDNPLLDHDAKEKIRARYGNGDPRKGEVSKAYRREYLCELIVDESRLVIPEFDVERHVIDTPPDPIDHFGNQTAYNGYLAADLGSGKMDFTGILAGYVDHNRQELIIVADPLLKGETLRPIVEEYNRVKEEELWFTVDKTETVDCWDQVRLELKKEYGLTSIRRPIKTKVEDNIAVVRNAFECDKIKILSKCTNLIFQLKNGMWKESEKNKDFERTETLGHLDLLMALCYMLRSVDWKRRPGQRTNHFTLGTAKAPTEKTLVDKLNEANKPLVKKVSNRWK